VANFSWRCHANIADGRHKSQFASRQHLTEPAARG
jgi:hypothetical protein